MAPLVPSRLPKKSMSLRILIAEDEALIAMEVEDALIEAGYEVVAVVNRASDALAKAEALRPDLCVMDIRLLDGSSLEAAGAILRGGVPVVLASGHGGGEAAAAVGTRHWLHKPYRRADLVRAVKAAAAQAATATRAETGAS
ncbi:MAG TPA: response regulator [Azospirillaceae bacterium]|nr:response regulator [Azospirillaceae bacterium]